MSEVNPPADVKQALAAIAAELGVSMHTLLAPRRRQPLEVAARARAMNAVSNIQIDGRPKYGLAQIAEWFGVARNRVNVYRQRAEGYEPRRPSRKRTVS